ncbi:MAG: phospholipase A [Bacteroidetes bacterium]|nr:phospholipase A [Bacteroidota bacterium]
MKKLETYLLVGFVPCLGLENLKAQTEVLQVTENSFFRTIRANQTDSYITFSQGIGNMEPLIFEALIAPYFLLRTSRDAKWGATISPAILMRMYAEESLPVRTPSYMSEICFYHKSNKTGDEKVKYLFLNLTHHSNGQDGDFFNQDGSFNTISGNFSINYLELGLFLNQNVLPFSNTNEYFKSSLEYHIDLERAEELEGRYSFIRWHNSFQVFRFLESNNASKKLEFDKNPAVQNRPETTWLIGNMNDASFFNFKERFNFTLTMAYRPKFLSDVSLYANFYSGEDYYNINFYQRIAVFRIGLQAYSFK